MQTMAEDMINSDLVCRACIAPHFEEKVNLLMMPDILEIYAWLSDSPVDANDLLPKFICAECYHQLEAIKRFRLMCTESYFKLHKISKHIIVEHGESYEVTYPSEYERMPVTIYLDSNAEDSGQKDCSTESGSVTMEDNRNNRRNKDRSSELDGIGGNCDGESFDEVTIADIKPEIVDFDYSVFTDDKTESFKIENVCGMNIARGLLNVPKNHQKRFYSKPKAPYPTKKNRYTCNKCGKVFHVKERYVGHMRQHEGLKPFKCKHCHKIYSRIERLRYHIESDHSGEIMRYSCPFDGCDKKYKNRETLKRHFIFHGPYTENENHKVNFSIHESRSDDELNISDSDYELKIVCVSCHVNFRKLLQHKLDYKSGDDSKCVICGKLL